MFRRAEPPILIALLVAALAFIAMPALALAGAVSPSDQPVIDLARLIYEGVIGGHYFAAAAGALVLVTAVLRRYGAQLIPWLASDVGGTALAFAGSLGGALLTAALGGAHLSWWLAWQAFQVGAAAVGGYVALKRLVINPLRPRAASWPTWARAIFAVVAWVFDRPEPSSTRAATAPITLVLLVALLAGGCATARTAGAAGANAALTCQSSSLQGLALEAYELARSYLVTTISDTGEVDTSAIRAAARQVRSDAGRCAFAAALAAITEAMAQRSSLGVLAMSSPPAELRQVFLDVQREDWQREVKLEAAAP